MVSFYSIPDCKGNDLLAEWIEARVSAWAGVESARCRASTGRLRIRWSDDVARTAVPEADVLSLINLFSLCDAFRIRRERQAWPERRPAPANLLWRSREISYLIEELNASIQKGLSSQEAQRRLKSTGANKIPPIPPRADSEIFLKQLRNPSSALLAASALASLITGGAIEAGLIAAIVLVNSEIGFLTERKAERTLGELSHLGPREAFVRRDGAIIAVQRDHIVPGDLLVLSSGLSIPADARVIEARDLFVDESFLTGESFPVAKSEADPVFRGSAVVSGSGWAVVAATGMRTEVGRIQSMLGNRFQRSTRLEEKLNDLNVKLVQASVGAGALLLAIGLVRGQPLLHWLRMAVSMAVAAVPEGLPTTATYCLSRVVSQLLGENVLVRDLQAIETLGSFDVLCLDKTGTLTENHMRVAALALAQRCAPQSSATVLVEKKRAFKSLLASAILCNDAAHKEDVGSGSPTESALLEFARDFGIDSRELRAEFKRVDTVYRTNTRSYMVTAHRRADGAEFKMMKGNPVQVLAKCRAISTGPPGRSERRALTNALRARIRQQNDELTNKALRVLGFAYQRSGTSEWVWLGLIGLQDPPREGIKDVLARFHAAGVRTVMITGDQATTAEAVARELGVSNGGGLRVIDFRDLGAEGLPDERLRELAANAHVFARVAPEEKRRIVELIRASGRVVAMVGDGINDAPALKAANLGIAIGRNGAEVAKEVASVVLLDDRIDRLLLATLRGRAANEALRRTARYLVSTNLSEMAIVLCQATLGLPEMMEALHLMWINLVGDTFPALALAMNKPDEVLMRERPRPDQPLLDRETLRHVGLDAGIVSSVVMGALGWGRLRGLSASENQTLAMSVLALSQILFSFSAQSKNKVDWRQVFSLNRPLVGAGLGSLAAQLSVTSVPRLRRFFHLGALRPLDAAVSAGLSVLSLKWVESFKPEPKVLI